MTRRNLPMPIVTKDDIARFREKIDAKGSDDCWNWSGAVNNKGYGRFKIKKVDYYAHRIASYLARDVDPASLCICHVCDNPRCCNPKHLFLGTPADNNRDCADKGRRARGARHWNAKLTESQVRGILASAETCDALALRHGVSRSQISRIRRGERQKYIPRLKGVKRLDNRFKLTEEAVLAIRASNKTNAALATQYGVCRQQISKVCTRENWGHLEPTDG
jgi:transcriptional regulator with XRE-family HTH domain